MDERGLEREIDHLYQLPAAEFTAARNALAKRAGAGAARVRALSKPPVAAWAVNQLYWRRRDMWDTLLAAAEEARRAHRTVLSGRGADIRAAGKVHEDAVDDALKTTLAILADAGHPATDTTRQAVATTLRALPSDEPAGRLSRTLQPGGFETLAGLSIASGPRNVTSHAHTRPEPTAAPRTKPATQGAKAAARARAAAAAAERELRAAEHAARREEFELAKATREERNAAEAVERARTQLERAKAELGAAEAAAKDAGRGRKEVEARSRRADAAVTAARARVKNTAE